MRNDSSTGQLIVGSFCIIFALIFYQLMQDSFVSIAGIIGLILVITGLHGYKGFSNKIVALIILFVFGGILIYLVFTFPFSSPEKKITISLLFVLILLWAVPFYMVRSKISEFNKGIKMVDSSNYEEASDYFNKILKNDPNDPLAWAGKAFTLQKIGKSEKSLQSIDTALSLKYKVDIKILGLSKLLINSLIFNTAGLIYMEEKDYENALEYFNKALEANKNFHTVWNNKGVALSKMGKIDGSLKCFDKALRYSPKSAGLLNNKGDALRKLGKCQEAMKYIDMALKIDSKIPHVWLTKGEILLCSDKKKDALNAFNEALKLDPDNEKAKKSREELLAKIN